MTFEETKLYLKKASLRGSRLGLERIEKLTQLLGDPQDKVKTVHISGTNGKGSFGAMLTSILAAAGYKVGGFSSPAITEVTDSFRINGSEISKAQFAAVMDRVVPLCEAMEDKPTEFEVLTAAAYELFSRENCDIAVVECGMGGDTDSTNVISAPLVSVITNVQLDHCGFLGNTVAEIAAHKAGIIKQGCPVYFGGNDPEALRTVRAYAEKMCAKLYLPVREDFTLEEAECTLADTVINYKGTKLHAALSGSYQFDNAVNVLSVIEILRSRGLHISDEAVAVGLKNVRWHGRFEVLCKDPLIIYDGSHNPAGIACAAESIGRYFGGGKVVLLIGVMADKDYHLYADMLGGYIHKAFTVKPDNPRSLDSDTLAAAFREKGIAAESFSVLDDGVHAALDEAKKNRLPLIALGSLYMYREFTAALGNI